MRPTLTQDLLWLKPNQSHGAKSRHPRENIPSNVPLEELTDTKFVEVLRWARDHAPELLTALLTAYGHRGNLPGPAKASTTPTLQSEVSVPSPPCGIKGPGFYLDSGANGTNLKELERQQIKRVLAESTTLREAASKLGIDETTLWRKRKRYRLY